jgi:hypothetical protein
MSATQPLAFLRLPDDWLIALDSRGLHFALQPYHHLIRLTHILSVAAFFGAIVLLDMRLLGFHRGLPLRPLAAQAAGWLYGSFAVALASGVVLFLYDPVHVGSHGYFVPKLILLGLALANAAAFHRSGYLAALAADPVMPARARLAGLISLALWTGVMICAGLNGEAAPKVLLR